MAVNKGSYYRVGVFVLSGLTMLVALVVIIGGAAVFQKTVPAETYFNESVQGLDVGAPVKYRGVNLGRVSNIGFIVSKYATIAEDSPASRYVLVEMELREDVVRTFLPSKDPAERLREIVASGLRVRLTTQGLTGVAFLEINFFDPQTNPPLPIAWTPEDFYFPSAPSTMSRLESALEAVGGVMRNLEQINFAGFAQTLDDFIATLDRSLQEANVKDIGQLLVQSLAELRDTFARVRELVEDPRAATIIPDISATAAGAKRIITDAEEPMALALQVIHEASGDIRKVVNNLENMLSDPALATSAKMLPGTLGNLDKASQDIRRSAVELDRLLRGLNDILQGQGGNVSAIVEDTRSMIENINELVEDVKRQPARLLFSEPPRRIEPEKLP